MLSKVAASIRRSFAYNLFFLLLLVYFFLYQYARISFYADPTSYFFNTSKAFVTPRKESKKLPLSLEMTRISLLKDSSPIQTSNYASA
jgi:hypothetical protein